MESDKERIERMDRQIEQNTQAIAQLIVLARTGVEQATLIRDSISGVTTLIDTLGAKLDGYAKAAEERSKELDERMNMLINIFDDFIRRNGKRKDDQEGKK